MIAICSSCNEPIESDDWLKLRGDFLDQYPNQRNDIIRAGPEAFGFPPEVEP